ncbi:TolC family outer membrane protein [Telmatospirillum sp.]|uniref:TolC family outer membrane protein n=1 Tax=Telmatospirillum sp. TaxID=2079197 RepID=UPI0028503B01|nr:TolC family outer membrane protein [Telmatospirillum sp.]MDR3441141.1 TolC family outer membrane protein [Telmatospirillum sp.]
MNRFRPYVCAAALLAAIGVSHPSRAQTLEEVLVTTYLSNPQIEADRARQRSLDDDVARALGGWRPVVQATVIEGRGHDIFQYKSTKSRYSVSTSTHEYRSPETLLLQIQQSIYDGGRTAADVRKSRLMVESGLAQMVSVEQTVLGQAIQSYYDLCRDQQIYDLSKQNVSWIEELAKATHARYAVKDVTQTDVAQAEARLAKGLADQTSAEGALVASRSAFEVASGIVPGVLPPPPPPPRHLLPLSKDEALALAETNPDIRSVVLGEKSAEADVDYVSSGLRPNLALVGESRKLGTTDQAYDTSFNNQVTLQLTVPLYEGGVSAARTRSAKQVVGQRKLEIDLTRRKVVDQVNRTWQSVLTARSSIHALTEQVRAAEVAQHAIRAEVRVGTRTVLDLLNTEQELMDAKIALARAQHDEAVATYSVLGSVGHLTASALEIPVEGYDPSIHYEQVRNNWFGTGIDENYDKPAPEQ